MEKRNFSMPNKSDGDPKYQFLKEKSISSNTHSTNLSSNKFFNATYAEHPEIVAKTFNIVPNFSLVPSTSLPRPSNTVTGPHPFQNCNPAHLRIISPNTPLQLASGTNDQSHIHNGIQYRPVTKYVPNVSNCSSILNTLSNNVSVSASLPVTSNTINVKLDSSSNIQPCTIFANTGSGVAEVINVTQKKSGNNSVQTGNINLNLAPGVNINASEFIAPAVGIDQRNSPQIQSRSSNVQTVQTQSQAVNSHGNDVLKAGHSHSFNAISFTLCQNDEVRLRLRKILDEKAAASKCSESLLAEPMCRNHVSTATLTSSAQAKNLIPEAKVIALDKVSSSQAYHIKDSKALVYGISAEKPLSSVDTGLMQDCGKYQFGTSKINMNSEQISKVEVSKPSVQTFSNGSPTISSTNMIPCKGNSNEERPGSKKTIIDVESEDIEDCMLVSIDLSKQKRSIGARIHNLQVVIDSDEDELVVTSSEKSDPKHSGEVLENIKKPDLSSDAENLKRDVTIQASKPNSQDLIVQSSSVNCLESDSSKIRCSSDSVKDQSFKVREDEDIEVYIDKDIKEERPFINPDFWQSSNSEISNERPEQSQEMGTSEVFPKSREENDHSTPQDILSTARANFTKVITAGIKSVFSSSSITEVSRKVKPVSCKKPVRSPKTKKVSANKGTAKKSILSPSVILNQTKHLTAASDATKADSTATSSKAASDTKQGISSGAEVNLNPESIAPELTDLSQNDAITSSLMFDKGAAHKEALPVEIKREPTEKPSETPSVPDALSQVKNDPKVSTEGTEGNIGTHSRTQVSRTISETYPNNIADSAGFAKSVCLKCKRSFSSNIFLQEHLKCSPSCKSYNQKLLTQHKPKAKESLNCVACNHTSYNIDYKFDHVANSPPCFKRYASLCISCNADVIFTSETDRFEQTKLCRKKHLIEHQKKPSISVDQLKAKQNTGLLLMSAGVATLSSVNPSTTCTVRCEGCSSWFSSYARFKLHVHAHQACKNFYDHRHSNKAISEGVEQRENKTSNKPKILCPVCSKRFATNAMLTIHMNENTTCRSKFLKYSSPKIAKRGRTVIKKIGKSPESLSLQPIANDNSPPKISSKPDNENLMGFNLKQMVIKLSPKSIMCSVCYKPFFDAAALSKHLASSPLCNKQIRDIPFQCQGCKKYFIGDAGLAKHIQKSFICQAKIDSTMSNPAISSAAESCPSAIDLNKDLSKTQKVHVLNVDLVKSEQNKTIPEVIRPHESLEKDSSHVMPQISVCSSDKDELNEIDDDFSSEESDEDDSSSTSSDEADVEFKCKTCDETFSEKLIFKQHMMQHRRGPEQVTGLALQKIKCKACRKKLKSLKEFQAHLLKRSFCFFKVTKQLWYKKQGDIMSCKMCHKVLKTVRDLGKHCFKNMTCRLCYVDAVLKTFANSSSTVCEEAHLALPKESRSGDKDLSSIQISESSVANKDLKNLNRPVLQEESLSYECEHCHMVFDSRFKFQIHFFNQKPDCLDHYATLGPQFQAQVPYCFRCKDRFINIHKLRIHKCIGFRRYVRVCGHCNFKFPNLATLEAHAQNSENCAKALETQTGEKSGAKTFSSPKKSKEVARKTTTQVAHSSHMSHSLESSKPQKEANLKVDKSFERKSNVARSGQQSPSKFKQFSCRVCLHKFPLISLLLDHSYEHSEEKQYDCKRCGFMCFRYNRLVSHEAVHERLDKECEHFNDRLDLHSVVVQDSGNSDYERNRSEDESDTHEKFDHPPADLKDSQKNVCTECGKSFESERALKKHLACSVRCRKKLRPQSHSDGYGESKAMKVKQESLPLTVPQPEEKKEIGPKIKPSVRIVRKMGSSGKRFLTATPVQEIPRGEHLFCFWCRRFLKSKEEIERHSVYERHAVLTRRILDKAVWLPGKYACKICKARVVQKGSLVRHMIRSHQGSELVAAPVLTFDKLQKSNHKDKLVTNSSRIFCSLCKTFITKNSKETHYLDHLNRLKMETRASSTLPLNYPTEERCKICQLQIKTRRGLLKHFDRHREEDIFLTPSSSSPQNLETESYKTVNVTQLSCLSKSGQRLKARNTPGRCKLCQKKFLHISLFKRHFKLSHSNRYPKPALLYFVKSAEDFTLKSVSQIRENLKPSHGSLGKKVNSSSTSVKEKRKRGFMYRVIKKGKHVCKVCNLTYFSRCHLRRHIHHCHEDFSPASKFLLTDKGNFICKICGAKHESVKNFKIHFALKHKESDAINSLCGSENVPPDAEPGFSFRRRRVLQCYLCKSKIKAVMYGKHLMMKHSWSKKGLHSCHYCNVDFPYEAHLQTHKRQCKKDCCCRLCGKQLVSVQGLRNHVIIHHKWLWEKYVDEIINVDVDAIEGSRTPTNCNTKCDVTEDKTFFLSNSSRECHVCKCTFNESGLYLEHMQTHLMPCKVNLGKKDKVPSKEIKVAFLNEGHENACSATERENSPPSTSVNFTQGSSKTTLLEKMADAASAFNGLTCPSNEVNLSVSEQARKILDQEQEYSNSNFKKIGCDGVINPNLNILTEDTSKLPLSDQNNLENTELRNGEIISEREKISIAPEKNQGIFNDLKRKANDSDAETKNMNTEKRKKSEICRSHENLQQVTFVEVAAVQNKEPHILSKVSTENDSLQISNTFSDKEPIIPPTDNSILTGSRYDAPGSTSDEVTRNDVQDFVGSSISSEASEAWVITTNLYSDEETEDLAHDVLSSCTSSKTPQAMNNAPDSNSDDVHRKHAQDILALSTSGKKLRTGDNSDNLLKDYAKGIHASFTPKKVSEAKEINPCSLVHIKSEKTDPEIYSEGRNLFTFLNDSVDLIDDENEDLQFISYERTTLEDFVKPRTSRSPVNVNQNFDISKNSASSSNTETSSKYSCIDSVINSSYLPDNERNVFDMLNN